MQDTFIISAVPQIKNVNPLKVYVVSNALSSLEKVFFIVKGHTFFDPKTIYVSANNIDMFDNFNFYTLSAIISGRLQKTDINAVLIPEFNYTENFITFELPEIPKKDGIIDIIVQNEAGYGNVLTSLNSSLTGGIQVVDISL